MKDRLGDRYALVKELGRGLDCTVWRATDEREPAQAVAIKRLHPESRERPGLCEGVEREWRRLVGLEIPHLMQIREVGLQDGLPYAVLPLLSGGTLRSRLEARRRPAAKQVQAWLQTLAQALDTLHARGLIHREVEPKNVYFDEQGLAVLSDFGIAKVLVEIPPPVRMSPRPGTFRYASPEACKGVGLGPASDQYSLALIAYEALCGRLPHEGASDFELLLKKIQQTPEPLRRLAPDLPAAASDAVMRALSPEPGQRFASCSEFAAAFSLALRQEASPDDAPARISLGSPTDASNVGHGSGQEPFPSAPLRERAPCRWLSGAEAGANSGGPNQHQGRAHERAELGPSASAGSGMGSRETPRQKARRALRGLGLASASLVFCVAYLALGIDGTPLGSPQSAPLAVVAVPWLLSILCGVLSRSSFLAFVTGVGPGVVVVPWQVLRSQQSLAVTTLEAVALAGLYFMVALLGVLASALTRRLWRRLDGLSAGP